MPVSPVMPSFSSRRFATLALSCLMAGSMAVMPGAHAENPELTVYNQNFALVKDYRPITLKNGMTDVLMDDVAALIDPTSVHFKSLTAPRDVRVREQNFRYDLISRQNILDRMVGQKIRFVKDGKVREGILLNPATTVIRNSGYGGSTSVGTGASDSFAIQTPEGVLLTKLDDILIDTMPAGLYPRPALLWRLESDKGGVHQSEVSYLTDGITWSCDYVAVLNNDDTTLDLTGWVTLDNQSGAHYENARLKLVAGDVRRAPQEYGGVMPMARAMMKAEAADASPFQEESFFEYHLYSLNGRTSVMNRETKQITLISASQIPVRRKYIYDPDASRYRGWLGNGGPDGYYGRPGQGWDSDAARKINTLVQFKNTTENRLGVPLPKGRIRVNKADASGSLQFVGEDRIDHTPTQEEIELYLGDAFDLVGEKKRVAYHEEARALEEGYQIKLRNRKKSPVSIHVIDHFFGDWTIRDNTAPFVKTDAHTVDFTIAVPPESEKTLTYTVRVRR